MYTGICCQAVNLEIEYCLDKDCAEQALSVNSADVVNCPLYDGHQLLFSATCCRCSVLCHCSELNAKHIVPFVCSPLTTVFFVLCTVKPAVCQCCDHSSAQCVHCTLCTACCALCVCQVPSAFDAREWGAGGAGTVS